MEIRSFAPVAIPTLCRFEHFKRCLESLERCTWADKTDVYIGLDYPPSEKYVSGWKKIDEYLRVKEEKHGFKNLYVRRRAYNYGAGKPEGNGASLLKEISQVSKTFIFSEDDNEFSDNFLDYINQGLTKFDDNSSIFAICGYNYPIDMSWYNQEYYFSHELAAWGYGGWFEKRYKVFDIIQSPNYLINLYRDYPLHTYFKNNLKLMSLATRLGDGFLGDVYLTSYLHSRQIYTVFPKKSKVRNWGHDGSGSNCNQMNRKEADVYTKQTIDNRKTFPCSEDVPIEINKEINKIVQRFMKPSWKLMLRRFILFCLIRTYSKIK